MNRIPLLVYALFGCGGENKTSEQTEANQQQETVDQVISDNVPVQDEYVAHDNESFAGMVALGDSFERGLGYEKVMP